MTQQSSLLTFQLPSDTSSSLSLCKPSTTALSKWLAALPKINTGEYSRQLLKMLSELNRLEAAPELRLQLLELVRPETLQLVRQLEQQHLLSTVILNERSSKVAKLCQVLLYQLYLGHKRLITDLKGKKSTHLNMALQRGLYSLYQILALSYLTYQPVPPSLWHELHQLFIQARYHDLVEQPVADNQLHGLDSSTPGQIYTCALLLGCAPANQVRQRDIKQISDLLPSWSHLARIQDIQAQDSLFFVALNSNSPPRYKVLLNSSSLELGIGLNTALLVNALRNSPDLDKQQLSPQLIEQLAHAWGDVAKRDFNRTPGQGKLLVTLGMSAVHFYLSNQQPFEDSLDLPPAQPLEMAPEEPEEIPDIWSLAADAAPESSGVDKGAIDYHSESDSPPSHGMLLRDYGELYPIVEADIVNQSHNGYCLEWKQQAPANLQTGDILALSNTDSIQWAVAVIRWISQQANTGAQIGVELLAVHAEPCGIRLIRSGQPASNYLRALRIPQVSNLDSPPQIITPRVPFREGCSVQINNHGQESLATLTQLCKQTASCNLFAYETSQEQAQQTAAHETKDPAASEDPFGTLWQVL